LINTKHIINFNPENCVGCKLCYKACFIDVIRWDEVKKQPVFKYVEDCEHCNYCEVSCKKGCIEVIPDFESQGFRQSFDQYR
jgi:formate hydrogenlyase subunit 6/NADH:ubiquinone oxidoreductase subunit I